MARLRRTRERYLACTHSAVRAHVHNDLCDNGGESVRYVQKHSVVVHACAGVCVLCVQHTWLNRCVVLATEMTCMPDAQLDTDKQ